MVNAIQNNGPYSFTLDISDITQGAGTDVIYIPASVIEALKTDNTSLAIRTLGAEYTLRPDTVDTSSKEVVALRKTRMSRHILQIYHKAFAKIIQSLPEGAETASQINNVSLEAVGTSFTYSQIRMKYTTDCTIKNRACPGKAEQTLSKDNQKGKATDIDEAILQLIGEIEEELSIFLKNRIDSTTGSYSIVVGTRTIRTLTSLW